MTAPARRPQVVLFDLFETCLQLEGLRPRFAALGRPEDEVWLFFARLLHQGMAMTLAGEAPPFATVAADMLRRTSGRDLTDDQVASVLDGFRELPVHPDVAPALRRLARGRGARLRVHARLGGGRRRGAGGAAASATCSPTSCRARS